MDLNAYVLELQSGRVDPQPLFIQIPLCLSQTLYRTKEESEEAVREMGYNLSWNTLSSKIEVCSEKFVGNHNSVSLNSSAAYLLDNYIGDFHVHPYRKKYGPSYSIGPSSADWEGWLRYFPSRREFSINIVASGSKLFLAIVRQKSKQAELVMDPEHTDVQNSQGIIFDFNYKDPRLGDKIATLIENKSWDALRGFYNTHMPQYASTHQQDVSEMNSAIARLNYGCAIYEGRLNQREITFAWLKKANRDAPTAIMAFTIKKCVVCGAMHGRIWSNPLNAWHKCTHCAAVYCPQHGKILEGKGKWYDRTRKCVRCGERTSLVSTV